MNTKTSNTKLTAAEFIERGINRFGDFFDYTKSIYSGMTNKVTIICPIHGEFAVSPVSFLNTKHGCRECSFNKHREKMRGRISTTEEFIDKAKATHGNRYDYSDVKYVRSSIKVKIHCLEHPNSPFYMRPNNHLTGYGCPLCSRRRYDEVFGSIDECTVYHVKIRSIKEPSVSFEKVGLTVSISSRFGSLKRDGFSYEILNSVVLPVQLAIQLEEDILSDLNSINKAYKIHHLKGTKTKGWTECFPCGSIDIKQKIMEYVDDNNYHT